MRLFWTKKCHHVRKICEIHTQYGDLWHLDDMHVHLGPLYHCYESLKRFCSEIKCRSRVNVSAGIVTGIEQVHYSTIHNRLTWCIWCCFTACCFEYKSCSDNSNYGLIDLHSDLLRPGTIISWDFTCSCIENEIILNIKM